MECLICKNTKGFVCGTCINCGYNYLDHTYHIIEVSTEILSRVVSPEVFNYLVSEHESHKKIVRR